MSKAKLKTIDKRACGIIRRMMESELALAAAELGLNVEVKNAVYDPDGFVNFKVEFTLANIDKQKVDWDRDCWRYDLEETDYLMPFTFRGKKYFLCGFKTRARKFPILADDEDGATYKFPASVVAMAKAENR